MLRTQSDLLSPHGQLCVLKRLACAHSLVKSNMEELLAATSVSTPVFSQQGTDTECCYTADQETTSQPPGSWVCVGKAVTSVLHFLKNFALFCLFACLFVCLLRQGLILQL